MAMSFDDGQAEARRLAALLVDKEKKVERLQKQVEGLQKALEEGGEDTDKLEAQLEEALRRLEARAAQEEEQQQQQKKKTAAAPDSAEIEEEVETLSKELRRVRSFCARLQRSQQYARDQQWAIQKECDHWRFMTKQAESFAPAYYREQRERDEQKRAADKERARQQQEARSRRHRQPAARSAARPLDQLPAPPAHEQPHQRHPAAAAAAQPVPPPAAAAQPVPPPAAAAQPVPPPAAAAHPLLQLAAAAEPVAQPAAAAAAQLPTAGVGRRGHEGSHGLWSRVLAAGLAVYFLFIVALYTTTTMDSSSGAVSVAFSGSGIVQAVSAVGRHVAQRAGVAMSAEEAIVFWRDLAQEEGRGRRAAEADASSLRGELHVHQKDLLAAREAVDRLERLYSTADQQRLALETQLSQESRDKARVIAERDDLHGKLLATTQDLVSEHTKSQQLEEELGMERQAADGFRKRVDVEVAARRDAESLAVRLAADMLDAQDQLRQCAQQRSSCRNALTGCEQDRRRAEARADELSEDKRYACVGWLADVGSQIKAAFFSSSPVPNPSSSPHADAYASSSTFYFN